MESYNQSPVQNNRYTRQLLIFGEEGQKKLSSSHVAIAGAGGLGSPVAYYLTVAGVGNITIIDDDIVELTNLNRQILHYETDIGKKKVSSGKAKMLGLNHLVTVHAKAEKINESTVLSLIGDASIIVDAMDNYETRYILNSFAVEYGRVLVHGAVRSFDGQITTVVPGKSACLACTFPNAPDKEIIPVIGITAGVVGLIQANEVIKYLLGMGENLGDRLLLWNGLESRLEEIKLRKRKDCQVCGTPGKQ